MAEVDEFVEDEIRNRLLEPACLIKYEIGYLSRVISNPNVR